MFINDMSMVKPDFALYMVIKTMFALSEAIRSRVQTYSLSNKASKYTNTRKMSSIIQCLQLQNSDSEWSLQNSLINNATQIPLKLTSFLLQLVKHLFLNKTLTE